MSDNTSLLRLIPERPVVRNDEVSEFDLVIEINTIASQNEKLDTPRDLNLCVVIDRSGSMEQDNKLEKAKHSCKEILKRLSAKDRFSLVVFDDEAQIVVDPATPRDQIFSKIESTKAGGQTNLASGWRLGVLELQSYTTDMHLNRLILLSDGQANQGETKASVLGSESAKARSYGITTSTIGIGADFQEDILATLAHESGGRFYYIQESKIEDILDEEFQGSLSTQIERPRIALKFPDGVTVIEELNELRKISGRYYLRPILSSDAFNFAIRVQVDPLKVGSNQILLKALLHDGEREIQVTEETVALGSFSEFVTSEENLVVKNIVQQYKTAKAKEKMIEQIDQGDFDNLKLLIVENVGDMVAVKDQLIEKQKILSEIDSLQASLQGSELQSRELVDVQEKLYKGEFMLILVDVVTYLRDLVMYKELDTRLNSFLARWRKLLVQDMHEEFMRGEVNRRGRFFGRFGRELDDSEQRDLLENSQEMISELLLKYPTDNKLQSLKARIHEQLERY